MKTANNDTYGSFLLAARTDSSRCGRRGGVEETRKTEEYENRQETDARIGGSYSTDKDKVAIIMVTARA